MHLGCVRHWSSTWTPGVVTELCGDLSKEALPAQLFHLQDPEETLAFSDSGAKPWDPLRSGMECSLLSIRVIPGSRLLFWVPEARSEAFRLWSVSKVLTLHILVSCLSSFPAALAWAYSQCWGSQGWLWSWGSPDDSPVDFYSLVVLDLGQICALLYKVWALNFIQQSGVALLGSSQGEANSSQGRGAQGVLAQLYQLQWISWWGRCVKTLVSHDLEEEWGRLIVPPFY